MKNLIKLSKGIGLALGLAGILTVAVAPNAEAITWTISPDANALGFGITAVDGVNEINISESASQAEGIYGAGFTMSGNNFSMDFDSDLYTWDSYNPNVGGGTGYWDAFVVTVSTAGYYWTLPHTDPIVSDASTFVWGGTQYGDGILESYVTAPYGYDTISLSSPTLTTFYVSLVLDTQTAPDHDINYASWGSFHVNPNVSVPEPATLILLGSGLIGLAAFGRKKFSN